MRVDNDEVTTTFDPADTESDDNSESWLAEQARLVLAEDGA